MRLRENTVKSINKNEPSSSDSELSDRPYDKLECLDKIANSKNKIDRRIMAFYKVHKIHKSGQRLSQIDD